MSVIVIWRKNITIFEASSTEQESGTWVSLARSAEFIRSVMAGYDWATLTSIFWKEPRATPVY